MSDKKIYTGLNHIYTENFEETPSPVWTVRHYDQPAPNETYNQNPISGGALIIAPAATTSVSSSSVNAYTGTTISVQPSSTYQVDIELFNVNPNYTQQITAFARGMSPQSNESLLRSNMQIPTTQNQVNHRFTFTTGATTQQIELWFYVQSPIVSSSHNGSYIVRDIEPFEIKVNSISVAQITDYQGYTADVQTAQMYFPFGM